MPFVVCARARSNSTPVRKKRVFSFETLSACIFSEYVHQAMSRDPVGPPAGGDISGRAHGICCMRPSDL